jgi:FkbM family methyltransferase
MGLTTRKHGLILVATACAAALCVSQISNAGIIEGRRSPPIFPAMPDDQHDPLLEACDLSQGLHMGHRRDVRRKYTFFTFDPTKDKQVSKAMISTGGLYDAHVHAALDVSLKALAGQGIVCNSDNVVLDVGSNLGTLALYSASLGCPTHAFEIQPAVACRLQMSIRANALDVTLHRNAVHSVAGKTFTFPSLPSNPGGVGISKEAFDSSASRTVTSVRLDDLFDKLKGGVLFMKIDTEGNEFEVLKSADGLLSAQKIFNFVVEVRQHQTDMVEFVYSHGYTCALIRETIRWYTRRKPITCSGRTVAQLSADVKGIEPHRFSDMFCCVT